VGPRRCTSRVDTTSTNPSVNPLISPGLTPTSMEEKLFVPLPLSFCPPPPLPTNPPRPLPQNDMYVSDVSAVAHPLPLLNYMTAPGSVFTALASPDTPPPWSQRDERVVTEVLSVMWMDLSSFQSSLAIFSEWCVAWCRLVSCAVMWCYVAWLERCGSGAFVWEAWCV
jgi:hypothetical protein